MSFFKNPFDDFLTINYRKNLNRQNSSKHQAEDRFIFDLVRHLFRRGPLKTIFIDLNKLKDGKLSKNTKNVVKSKRSN